MSIGKNLQYLRKMRRGMTQEELAEMLSVSRQTVSKWELDQAYPELEKLVELCNLFFCTIDQLVREDMTVGDDAYSNIRREWVEPMRYLRYAVISQEPEDDAIEHVRRWAQQLGISDPDIIGWDFPVLSQEQINVYNMHGYAAALILGDADVPDAEGLIMTQERQEYAAITIKEPFTAPFRLIPDAYKTLMTYMRTNGLEHTEEGIIPCFERSYTQNGTEYMDVFIAIKK